MSPPLTPPQCPSPYPLPRVPSLYPLPGVPSPGSPPRGPLSRTLDPGPSTLCCCTGSISPLNGSLSHCLPSIPPLGSTFSSPGMTHLPARRTSYFSILLCVCLPIPGSMGAPQRTSVLSTTECPARPSAKGREFSQGVGHQEQSHCGVRGVARSPASGRALPGSSLPGKEGLLPGVVGAPWGPRAEQGTVGELHRGL